MIKRAILSVLSLFLGSNLAFGACDSTTSPTYTPNTGLAKPSTNSCNWGNQLNANFSIIDSSMAVLSGINTFTGSGNNFNDVSIKSSNALSLNNLNNNASVIFQNQGLSGQAQLSLIAPDGIGINNSAAPSFADVLIYGGTNQPYGRFAVVGSSANSTAAYSGFIATSPVSQSTLWSLPLKDGTNGQALITNGSGNLSFSTISGGGGSGSSPLGVNFNGVSITTPTAQINFVGSGVSVAASGSTATVTVTNTSVYAATATASFPFGVSLTTITADIGIHSGNAILNLADTTNSFSSGHGYGINLLLNGHLGNPTNAYGFYGTMGIGPTANEYVFYSSFTSQVAGPRFGAWLAATGSSNENYALWVDSGQVQINSSMTVTGGGGITETYGITAATFTANSPGDGNIQLTIAGSTYTVVSSSAVFTPGHLAMWGATTNYTLVDGGLIQNGLPGAPFNSVQYNNANSFGGSNNFEWNGTSVTLISSMSILVAPNGTNNGAVGTLNVYSTSMGPGDGAVLFSAGSSADADDFWVKNGQPAYMRFGANLGNLEVANTAVSGDAIYDVNSSNNNIYLNAGQGINGEMSLESAGNIVLMPGTVAEVNVSTINVSISTSVIVNTAGVFVATMPVTALDVYGSGTNTYSERISTFTAGFALAVSSSGHVLSNGPLPGLSSCGGGTPSVVGDDYQGTITTGSGSPTACTLTFAQTYGTGCLVQCLAQDNSAATDDISAISPTAVTFTIGVTGTKIYYRCTGYGAACR